MIGTDERQPGRLDGFGERRALRQESVARMDRLGPRGDGGLDDGVGPKIALGGRRRSESDGL